MDTESPRVGKDARAGKSIATDNTGLSKNRQNAQPKRECFRVIVSAGIWKGFDVLIEPPIEAHRVRHFREHGEALTFAGQLAALQGWPILDRTGGTS